MEITQITLRNSKQIKKESKQCRIKFKIQMEIKRITIRNSTEVKKGFKAKSNEIQNSNGNYTHHSVKFNKELNRRHL